MRRVSTLLFSALWIGCTLHIAIATAEAAEPIKVGVIGLDNYQAVAFTYLFHRAKEDDKDLLGIKVFSDNYFSRSATTIFPVLASDRVGGERQLEFPLLGNGITIATPYFHGGCDGHGWTSAEVAAVALAGRSAGHGGEENRHG